MGEIASQITRLAIVYSTVYSDSDQRKKQSPASLAFVRWIREFPAQMASYAENVSIWWRHHGFRQSRMGNTESFVDVMNFSLNDKYDVDDVAKNKWINK